MNGEKGQALPLAMLALTIGALIIAPFLGHAGTSLIGSRAYASAIANRNAADAGVEHAIWSLTRGTLAAQIPNSGDHVTYQLGEALNNDNITVTVTTNVTASGGVTGNITNAIIDTLDFDTNQTLTPDIIAVSSNICAVAYCGASNKGYLETASIASNGNIGNSVISTLNFDTSAGYEPDIYQIASNIFAIAYRSSSNKGYLKTVSITSSGVIGGSVISTLNFDSTCYIPKIIQVSSSIYAIAYRGSSNHGYLVTVSISASGVIGSSVISTLQFDTSTCYEPAIIYVSGNYYAIAYRGASNRGYLKTVSITTGGVIGSSVISSLTFDSSGCWEPDMVQVASTIFAIAYRGSSNGSLITVSINSSGVIGSSVISTLIFDSANSFTPDIIQVASNTFAIAYGNSNNKGYLKTVSIASNGTISPAVISTFNFDTSSCYEPSMMNVTGSIFAIAYRGSGNDGYLITIGISTGGTTAAAAYRIVSTAGGTTISALVNTSNTTASIVSWQIQ